MSSSDGESIFLTQSNYKIKESETVDVDTDTVITDVLDMENGDFELRKISQRETTEVNDAMKNDEVHVTDGNSGRFGKEFEKEDLEQLVENGLSKKAESKSRWAVSLFKDWLGSRSEFSDDRLRIAVKKDIKDIENVDLNELMCYFLAEVKNQQGGDYMPNTLYEIAAAIQHHIRQTGRFVSFYDDQCFEKMRKVLDAKMKELSKRGLGLEKKKADVISTEQEEIMWQNGILGTDTPQKLLDTLVYSLGLNFALRAGQEHRNLRVGALSQIKVVTDEHGTQYLEYREDVSKTNRGGLKHRKMDPKVTRAYANSANPGRCPIKIYEKYISLR